MINTKVLKICPVIILTTNYLLYSLFENNGLKNVSRISALALLILNITTNPQIRKISLTQIICISIALLSTLLNGLEAANILFLYLIGLSLWNTNESIKYFHRINIIIIYFLILIYAFGIVSLNEWRMSIESERTTRYTLGTINPNGLAIITTSYIYTLFLKHNKKGVYDYLLAIGILAFNFFVTNSRTSVYSSVIFISLIILNKKNIIKQNGITWVTRIFINIIFIVNIFLPLFIEYFDVYNNSTTMRIELLKEYLSSANLYNFFIGGIETDVDNSYMYLLYKCGLAIYGLFFIMVNKTINKLNSNKDVTQIIFILSIMISGLFENILISPEYITSILLFNIIVYSTKNDSKEKTTSKDAIEIISENKGYCIS